MRALTTRQFVCVFRDSEKSSVFIFINSHVNNRCIYPEFHWALQKGILYLKIKLLLLSYTCVSSKANMLRPVRVQIAIRPPF